MKVEKRRILSIVLAILLMFQFIPANAMDGEEPTKALGEAFDYTIFAANPNMPCSMELSNGFIKGHIHTNNSYVFRGSTLTIEGFCEASEAVVTEGSDIEIDQTVEGTSIVEMPDYIKDIKRIITTGDSVYDVYPEDKQYNGNNIKVENSILVDGKMSANCSGFTAEGYIVAKDDIAFNTANNDLGMESGIVLCSENGNITFNSSITRMKGIVYAPKGTVTINSADFTLSGRIIADQIIVRGKSVAITGNNDDIDLIFKESDIIFSSIEEKYDCFIDHEIQFSTVDQEGAPVSTVACTVYATGHAIVDTDAITDENGNAFVTIRNEVPETVTLMVKTRKGISKSVALNFAFLPIPEAPVAELEIVEEKPCIKWNRVEHADSYTIKRGTESGRYTELVADVRDTSYTDLSIDEGKTYYYVVSAVNDSGESPNSNEVVFMSIPEAPILSGRKIGDSAWLSWVSSNGASSYNVYRGSRSGGPYIQIAQNILGNSYDDRDLTEEAIFFYVITAENEKGQSVYSNEVEVRGDTETRIDYISETDDDDGDGLTNLEELFYATNPLMWDSDNDGLSDGQEIELGTDPLNPDTMGDGIYDGAKVSLGLDPLTVVEDPKSLSITKSARLIGGEAEVTAEGNGNFILAPLQIKKSDDVLINSLEGIVGNAVEITSGGYPIKEAQITFHYSADELNGIPEENLAIFYVNRSTKSLEPLSDITIDTENKTVTAKTNHFSTFLLADSNIPIDLSKVDIVFSIDQSGSMGSNDRDYYRLQATKQFIEKMDETNNRIGVVEFSSSATIKNGLTNDKERLLNVINGMYYNSGSTNIRDSLVKSGSLFTDNSRRKAIILLTDGEDSYSSDSQIIEQARSLAAQDIVINTIALGRSADTALLQQIASVSKGGYFYINNESGLTPEDVEKQIQLVYEKLAKQLTLQEYTEDRSRLPKRAAHIEFSDLYKGLDYEEIDRWLSRANANLLTGNYMEHNTDISIQSEGIDLTFERMYNSFSNEQKTAIGNGFRTNYDSKLENKGEIGIVTASLLNVREGTGTDHRILGRLTRGTEVEIIESNVEGKPWHKIRYFNLEAYVHSSYITMENSSLIEVTYPSGTKILFRENAEGKFSSPMNTDDILEKVGDEYVLTRKDLSKLKYDALKRLIAIEDRNGNAVTVHYSNGKIERVTDPVGRYLTFSYNADGLIERVTDPSGRYVSYEYDANGNLVEVTDLNGESTKYTYDASNRINKKTDANGNQAIRNEYDSLGRIVRQYDGKDHIKYHIYDDENYTRYLIDENGIESRVEFNINLMPIVNTNTYGEKVRYRYSYYDSDTGAWIDITDLTDASEEYRSYVEKARDKGLKTREEVIDKKGNKTINEFNEGRNLVAVTDAMSNRIFMTYDNKGNLTSLQDKKGGITTYTYDAEGILLTQKTDAMGNVTEYEYYSKGEATSVPGIDIRQSGLVKSIILHKTGKNGVTIPDFQRTTYRYEDDYNYITSITDGVGNTTSYRYDSVGRVIEQVDPRGNSVYFSYDMMNRLLSQTDSLGNEQIYTYDGVGNRISSTDKLGATTYYEYDSKNQLVKVIDPMGYSITYQYDPRGNLVRETNPKGGETRYVYDSINRLVMKTDPLGHTTVYEYDVDPEGNQNDPDYHNVKVIDAEGNVSITEYDCLNRVVVEKQLLENPYYGSASKEIAVTYTYDLNDNIETVTDPMGKVTKYNYDDLNRMISVTDGFGLGGKLESTTETEFDAKADADGNVSIVTVIDPSGERTQTYYDAIDRKIKEVDAKGYETLYSYDGIGNLLTTTDPEGNTNTFEYDELNRVIKAYDAENNYITYEYDANGNKTAEVDKKGNRTEFIYDRNNRLIQIIDALSGITNYTYDGMGNIATETDPENNTKAYQYNDAGMLICEEDAENNSKHYTYDALGRVIFESGWINPGIGITTEYDEAGRVKQIIDALGNSTEYTYDLVGNMKTLKDANGNITAYEYDQRYQLVTEIEPGDSSVDENQINYEYDELGRLVKKQDSFGTVTELEYDPLSQLTGTIVRDENNLVKIAEYKTYNGNGQVLTQTDGNSVTTTYEYNSLNLLKTQTKDGKTTSYTYDNNGNLQAETDWRGNTYTYSYDELNRLQQKRDPYNNTIETLVYYKNGAQKQSIDALGNVTTFYYDGNGRLVKTEDPEGNVILTEYDGDGNVIRTTDGGGNTTEYEYDSAARLISVRNALNETTAYTYDHNGNMLTQKDGEGNITTYKYNVRNLPYQRIDDGGEGVASKTESYTYYANNLLKTKTDRNGTVISYTYDVFGRLQKEIAGSLQTSYTYDNNGNPLTINDSIGTTIRTYDALNRVTSKTVPNMGTVTYEYDIIEGVGTGETAERTTDPKGNITTKIYDRAGRLKAVIDGDITSTDITTYEYYDNGSRQSVTYPTGIREEYTYYPDNTLWTLTNKDADGTILDVYTYTYDHANNQTSKHEVINGIDKGTTTYTYDELNRLLTVTEPSGRETGYTYDMAGNRTMELISSGNETISNIYSYNEQNRLVYITTQVDSELTEKTEYCYDHNGNQLETIVTEYIDGVAQTPVTAAVNTYDSKNQLIETVTANGTTLTNAYNGEGLRVSKTVNGQTTTFLYEYNKVVLETNADGTEKARNLYGTNLLMRTVDGESYYYLYNGHADVTALIDTDGNIAATYYYDAFGNILEQTGDVDNNITYAGYQYDDETGLYYLNARMYDPKIARFLQEDTYRGDPNDPLSLNLYTYCANNPLIYFDPTGHDLWKLSTLLSYAEGEMYEKNGILYITANGISREYSKDELFNYEGEYIIDDDLFRLDFNYHKSFFDFFKKKLRLDDNNNDIRSLNKYEYTLENFRNASGYGKLYESTVLYYEGFIEDYGLVGYYFAASKEDDLYRLFNKKGPYFSEREAYSLGLTEFGATALELTYKSNKLGYSFAEMEREYQEPKQAERNALLAMMAFSIAVGNEKMPSNTNYLGRGPKDPEYYIVNNERVYYERPSGYIFESDPKFALDGSQTAFSVLYPDGRLLWDEGTRSTVTSNKGNVYDDTPSSNHSTTTGNPMKGEPNSSIDILDKNGNIKTRRWFGPDGNQIRDIDYTNHGNPKTHPEWPHEHGPRIK